MGTRALGTMKWGILSGKGGGWGVGVLIDKKGNSLVWDVFSCQNKDKQVQYDWPNAIMNKNSTNIWITRRAFFFRKKALIHK